MTVFAGVYTCRGRSPLRAGSRRHEPSAAITSGPRTLIPAWSVPALGSRWVASNPILGCVGSNLTSSGPPTTLCVMPNARRYPGRFLAPNGRTITKPLREVPSLGAHPEDVRREAEQVADHTSHRDEPEGLGPAILETYAQVNRRIITQQHILDVAEAQERRPDLEPQKRLDDIHRRAKHAHVDLSHEIHLVQRAVDKARLRELPVNPRALERLERLEALLDGVSIQSLAA